MTRALSIVSNVLAVAIPIGFGLAIGVPGDAQAQYAPPPPPAAYVATSQPEHFEGRPVYWYYGNWYYRDEHGWNSFRNEPPYLRERRAGWANRPRYPYHR
jgi:hypothetical protein